MSTPFSATLKRFEFLISSARVLSSSTSQLAQTNLPFKNSASAEASQTAK